MGATMRRIRSRAMVRGVLGPFAVLEGHRTMNLTTLRRSGQHMLATLARRLDWTHITEDGAHPGIVRGWRHKHKEEVHHGSGS